MAFVAGVALGAFLGGLVGFLGALALLGYGGYRTRPATPPVAGSGIPGNGGGRPGIDGSAGAPVPQGAGAPRLGARSACVLNH